MVLQFACSKAGLVLYNLDPKASSAALASALEATKANVLVAPEAHDDVDFIQKAHEIIPELRTYDVAEGMPFMTPRFPHLRVAVHTGFDQDAFGWVRLRHLVVPSNNLKDYVPTPLSDATPLAGELTVNGDKVTVGKVLTNAQVVSSKAWPTYASILSKEYTEVEGVGVVF